MADLYTSYTQNNNFFAPVGELPNGDMAVEFQADKEVIMNALWETLEKIPGFDHNRPKPRLDFNGGWFDNWAKPNCQLYASIESELGGTIERWHQTENLMYLVHRPSGASVSYYSGDNV